MKQSEIISLSSAELQEKLSQSRKTYADLKTTHTISPIQNPLQIKAVRRTIARLVTELSKRELQ
ncbi:MAG TPA: 50S ribosomal protein L29 [Flavobacterium sp.]|jgi:large subunit ribosomal protein L29|uniref:50S ribosomal protein L29 n=1 Tax=Flavobacterium sp. TaxID=239 RepID=UPI0025BA8F2D|nr:50S ribosomal protein L29 [Flavobacterium sp.]MBA4153311.1 50S ribosomal protein L29 [Flavobacterium sp.]HRZ31343.1 50S ribosomal protein L29 [Flavobacterium sp.]HRZ73877.1 50S ribosomal protein L29 [Flavobacterium sp.]